MLRLCVPPSLLRRSRLLSLRNLIPCRLLKVCR
jgi:hypothetical protein